MSKLTVKFAGILGNVLLLLSFCIFTLVAFLVGFVKGFTVGNEASNAYYKELIKDEVSATSNPVPTGRPVSTTPRQQTVTWGGPQLWDAVNKRRVQLGVNPLQVKDEVCTVTSIRLNQILDLGKLDGHKGFSEMPEARPDLKWIFEKYNLSEFLVSGAASAEEAVSLWENTLGHKELLSGGQYVWGCIYAQNGYGVAVTAY